MNKIKYYFILTVASLSLFSCSKSDSSSVEPLRDYTEQYKADINDIEDYLNANTITITNAPGKPEDQDVKIELISKPGQKSIKSYEDSSTFPSLRSKIVKLHGIDYKLYFLVLREGVGESPCNVDGVLASYKGTYLYRKPAVSATEPSVVTAFQFEEVVFPQDFSDMYTLVKGWGETFPNFKVGTVGGGGNGAAQYNDFGAGVMFLPSGLAYYAGGGGSIPAYSPLVFSFKLYALQRLDHDGDGVLSYREDKSGDGYVRDMRNKTEYPGDDKNPDDTDEDGIPDFLDIDDDGDYIATKVEIKNPDTGKPFPFESIPVCTPSGKKNYLDPSCYPGSK